MEVDVDPKVNGPATMDAWRVEQIIDDPAGDHDWCIRAQVDLAASEGREPQSYTSPRC